MSSAPRLVFGVDNLIDLIATKGATRPAALAANPNRYVFQTSADGTSWGNPDAVITEIRSQLLDGSIGEITSYDNRTATVALRIAAADMDALAVAEAALYAEVRRAAGKGRNQLVWTPAGASVSTVFDVVYSDLQFTFDDFGEQRKVRTFTLTLTCLPASRSEHAATVTALPAPSAGSAPVLTSVDAATSVTGWSTINRRETRRNLCPNPCGQGGTYGWAAGANSTRVFADVADAAGITGSGATTVFYVAPPQTPTSTYTSYVNGTTIPVTAGVPYAVQMRVGVGDTAHQHVGGFLVRFFDAGGNMLDQDTVSWNVFPTLVRGTWTGTAPAGATKMAVYPFVVFNPKTQYMVPWAYDQVMIEQSSSVGAYFDGSTAPSGATTYGWTGGVGTSPSIATAAAAVVLSGGHVSVSAVGSMMNLNRAGAIPTQTPGYLVVTGNYSNSMQAAFSGRAVTMTMIVNGTALSPALVDMAADGTFTAYWHMTMDVPASGFALLVTDSTAGTGGYGILNVTGVDTATGLPQVGTGKQGRRQLPVYGSARTQASLRIECDGTAGHQLGDQTLVYTQPANNRGFAYALRADYRASGPSVTSSSAAVSGYTNALATSAGSADTWHIDTDLLADSPQMLYARIDPAAAATVTFTWSIGLTSGQAPVATGTRTIALATGAQFVPLGPVNPPRVHDGSQDTYELKLWASVSGVPIEDAYLFDTDGNISIIGTQDHSLLRLDSASLDEPLATVWVGDTDADPISPTDTGVVSADWRALAREQHQFLPGTVEVFTVTPGYAACLVTLGYYPRWAHHASVVPLTVVVDAPEAAA